MLEWQNLRACNDSALDFFPTNIIGVKQCKAVCAVCPVRRRCLEYALELKEYQGVWGGTSGKERRRIVRERRAAA